MNTLKINNLPLLQIRLKITFKDKNTDLENLVTEFLKSNSDEENAIKIDKLPNSEISESTRHDNSDLTYLPLKQLSRNQDEPFFSVGDKILWIDFRDNSLNLVKIKDYIEQFFSFFESKNLDLKLVHSLTLNSVYVLKWQLCEKYENPINLQLKLNQNDISSGNVSLTISEQKNDYQINEHAVITKIIKKAKFSGGNSGTVIDIDVTKNIDPSSSLNCLSIINRLLALNEEAFYPCVNKDLLKEL